MDDLFFTKEDDLIDWCKKELTNEFKMKDLGLLHYFIGLEVQQSKDEVFLLQGKYIVDILKRFGMLDCKSMSTATVTNRKKMHDSNSGSNLVDPTMYKQLIGSLLYLIHTRPHICYAMSALSQFMVEPTQRHWVAAKHILRYLRETVAYGLKYTSSGGILLHCYADSDWAGSPIEKISTTGYCFNHGSTMISWCSRKQGSIAQSTTEDDYIAANDATREALWLRKLISRLFGNRLEMTVINCDNQSYIKLTENPIFPDKSKNI